MLRAVRSAPGALLLCAACVEPSVAARVVWLDDTPDAAGEFRLRVYDAGSIRSLTVRPRDPGSKPEQLLLDLSPSGRSLAVGNSRDGLLLDLDDDRMLRLPEGAVDRHTASGGTTFSPLAWFPRAGDAFGTVTTDVDGLTIDYRIIPVDRGDLREHVLELPTSGSGFPWSAPMTAADAPVVVMTEQAIVGGPPSGAGIAWAYPSDVADPDSMVLLGRGKDLFGQPSAVQPIDRARWCRGACLDPGGTSLYYADLPCTLWRWRFREPGEEGSPRSHTAVAPERVVLPDRCRPEDFPQLLAAVGPDQLVLGGFARAYYADLASGALLSVPLPSTNAEVLVTNRGRRVLLIDPDGPVIRVDEHGPRILSAVQSPCAAPFLDPAFEPSLGRVVASPGGSWAAWTCVGDRDGGFGGIIIRVSELGLERLDAIPMQTVAIDDQGNLLLYSVDPDGVGIVGEPRGLYVYETNGRLSRVDGLDPAPASVRMFAADPYMAAVALGG